MAFKRVPRLFFRPSQTLLGLEDGEESDERQAVLRENRGD